MAIDGEPERQGGRGARRLRLVAGVLLVALAVGLGAWAVLGRDGSEGERPVGRLIASDLPGAGDDAATTDPGGASTPAAGPSGSSSPQWPGEVQGRPVAFGADGDLPPTSAGDLAPGFYLWQDFKGWHLWLVGDPGAAAELVLDGEFARADAVGGDPQLTVDGDRILLERGGADEAVVGVDFSTGFYGAVLDVSIDGDAALFTGTATLPAAPPLRLEKA